MRSFLHDVRYAARLLRRSPGFAIVAVVTLAIGIGATAAIFSVVHALLLKELPFRDPHRLAVVWEHNIPRDRKNNVVSPGNFIHWREMQQTFEDLGSIGLTQRVTLTGGGEPEELPAQLATASLFSVLGVQPIIGRAFTADDGKSDSRVVVITERLWQRRFNRDPAILDRPITLQGQPHTVLGVMPRSFTLMDATVDVWLPVVFGAQSRMSSGRWLMVFGRMKTGVTTEQAQADMARVHAELTKQFPATNTGWTARVVPLAEQLTGNLRLSLLILLGAVALVLLIGCANVANLLLARATARQRELAVRAALGANRTRLVRQLLAESLLLAVLGGTAGILLAWWSIWTLRVIAAPRLPIQRLETIALDPTVLLFTAAVSLISAAIFGLVPAFTAAATSLTSALKDGGRSASSARGGRARQVFVVVQMAVALTLLVGAGLLVRSFVRITNVDAGFDPARTVTMTLSLPGSRYPEAEHRSQFLLRLFERIDALPGVEAAGATSFLPLAGLGAATTYFVVGQERPAAGQHPITDVRVITHDYFAAMRIPLLRGRLFNEHDKNDWAGRVVISEALARRHWPGADPIGKRIQVSWNNPQEDEVIGVVGDVRNERLDGEVRGSIYWPHRRFAYPSMTMTIRTSATAAATASSVIAFVRAQDPDLAVANILPMEEVVGNSIAERKLVMQSIVLFGGAALVLAAVGLYGVLAYAVSQRRQEIGIRMALGADRRAVLLMVLRESLILALSGIAAGGAAAFVVTRFMSDLLFEVRPSDPTTFAVVAAGLGLVALLAAYVPGRRATRVDPVVALRAD